MPHTRAPFTIGGETISPGTRRTVNLPVSLLSTHTPVSVPVSVVHGKRDGATVFVSAAIHGDEIIGVEIIRRLLRSSALRYLRGTLICVPVVNVFGFVNHSRYLPDRRDLNRSFPGTERGSLAGQVANLFMSEIVERCDFGIDLHSAAIHRANLPQLRISEGQETALDHAMVFGAPVVVMAPLRDGSLRAAAADKGVDVMVYEGGEALRFDNMAITTAVRGILRILKKMDMLRSDRIKPMAVEPYVVSDTTWLRAPAGGVIQLRSGIGKMVREGDTVGVVTDPFGEHQEPVNATRTGLIIGQTRLPIVNQGDALLHIAETEHVGRAKTTLKSYHREVNADPLFDEDEIL